MLIQLKMLIMSLYVATALLVSFDLTSGSFLETAIASSPVPVTPPNIASRLGESVLLECGQAEHTLLRQLESTVPSMPVLVNWFKHYSLTRRSDKPIYAKYLANNIDYAPHISADYESRLHIVDKINLNITGLRATDEALYECRLILFDKAYADSHTGSQFYLQVHVAPEFEYPNEDLVYFKPNVPIRLYCYARGKPMPRISWYKNDFLLPGENSSVLQQTFTYASDKYDAHDMFEFKCRVENSVGAIEHRVKVIKSGSLFFTEPLRNLTVNEGTILNWPCLAQSNADITYKWFKDSISVQSTLYKWTNRGALFQDGMLYLLEAYRNDTGLYECHAFTPNSNKRIEAKAYLNVLYGPEITSFSREPVYALESTATLVLDCVAQSNPRVQILEWFKDTNLLSNTKKYQILANNSLVIRDVEMTDRGQYYCSCNNTIKRVVSDLIRLEVIQKSEIEISTLYTSSKQSTFSLPCKSLPYINKIVADAHAQGLRPGHEDIKWFKLNAKYQDYNLGPDGSLHLQNVHSSDSGLYFCKVQDEFIKSLNLILNSKTKNKNSTKTLIQYSLEQPFTNNKLKLVKLNVIQSKSDIEEANLSKTNDDSPDKTARESLPLAPFNITIHQQTTNGGILIAWQYPKPQENSATIESFQIYFRELNNNMIAAGPGSSSNAWKTSEPIDSSEREYFLSQDNFNEEKLYEFRMVSFSAFSKSLPSPTLKLKIASLPSNLLEPYVKSIYAGSSPIATKSDSDFFFLRLASISQLDLILIAIFAILLFIMILSIVACIAYRRSLKSFKKKTNSKNSKDFDEWGFNASSGATTSFLSSTSSSEKSFNLFKAKSQRDSTIDCDLISKPTTHAILYSNTNHYNDLNDDEFKLQKPYYNNNIINQQMDNNYTNFYYPNSAITINTTTPMNNNKHSSSSSGVATSTGSSSTGSTDDNNSDDADNCCNQNNPISVNTIKYNAKTNIVHQQNTNSLLKTKNVIPQHPKNINYSTLQQKTSNPNVFFKSQRGDSFFNVNNKPGNFKTISFGTTTAIKSNVNFNSVGTSSCKMHKKKTPHASILDSLLENSNTMTVVGGIGGEQENHSEYSHINKNNLTSFNSFRVVQPKQRIGLPQQQSPKEISEISQCFNWLNDATNDVDPQTATRQSLITTHTSTDDQSDTSSLYSSKVSPLPSFPTDHFQFLTTTKTTNTSVSPTNQLKVESTIDSTWTNSSRQSSSSGCSSENPNSLNLNDQYYTPSLPQCTQSMFNKPTILKNVNSNNTNSPTNHSTFRSSKVDFV